MPPDNGNTRSLGGCTKTKSSANTHTHGPSWQVLRLEHQSEIVEHSFEIASEIAEINDEKGRSSRSVLIETPLALFWQRKRKTAQS
jgi:hypothetical protein